MRRFTQTRRHAKSVIEMLEQRQLLSSVVGAHLFYNDSSYDQNNAAIMTADDSAIATDKTPLRELGNASFANYSSYSKGINGVMIDIAGLNNHVPSLTDFSFHVGTTADPSTWARAPIPLGFAVRQGAGVQNSDRVEITWANNAISKEWLQVTTLATTNTLLFAADTFYFGNIPGETGNQPGSTRVDATDQVLVRNNPHSFLNPATITNPYDFNRDTKVDASDQLIARDNGTNFLSDLKLITPPPNAPGKVQVQVLSGSAVRVNWRDNSNVETGYQIDESTGGGAFTPAATATPDATAVLIHGLSVSTSYTFRVGTLGGAIASPSATMATAVTSSTSTTSYYEVTLTSGIIHGEASYTAVDKSGDPITVATKWVSGTSWQDAVYQAVGGTAHVNDTNQDYTFNDNSGAFKVDDAATLHNTIAGNDLPTGAGKVITLEDSYGTTNIDADYDDFYWTVDVKSVQFSITKTSSDQIPGEDDNYISTSKKYTGNETGYILMGNRSDDMAYAKLDFTFSGDGVSDFKRDAKFAWQGAGGYYPDFNAVIDTSSWTGDRVFIHGPAPQLPSMNGNTDYATHLEIQVGFDNNKDGRLSVDELAFRDPNKFYVVTQDQYNRDITALQAIYTAGGEFGTYPHAANFLYSFVVNQGLKGAVNVNTTINASDNRLSHHVGANFTVSGNANKAIFNASNPATTLPQDIASSDEVKSYINTTIEAHMADLIAQAPPVGQDASVGPFILLDNTKNTATGITFSSSKDLHYAINRAGFSGQVSFELQTRMNSDGTKELIVTTASLVGQLTDLYDFDYGHGTDPLNSPAAAVQAGYPTLGSSGHIFEIEVNMNNQVNVGKDIGVIP